MAHSSGNWTWREAGGFIRVEGPLGTLAIVFTESRTPNGGRTGVIDDEGEANARLMAAAPSMASALRDLVDGVGLPVELASLSDSALVTFSCSAGEMKRAFAALARAGATESSELQAPGAGVTDRG